MKTASTSILLFLLSSCRTPTEPRDNRTQWVESDTSGFHYTLYFDPSMKKATLEGRTSDVEEFIAPWSGDTLHTTVFTTGDADSITLNLWSHSDTLRGDIIKPEGWWWVAFIKVSYEGK